MSDTQQSDLPLQIVENLKKTYAQETEERKRLRAQNAEQIIVALAGGPDPFGKPARKNRGGFNDQAQKARHDAA